MTTNGTAIVPYDPTDQAPAQASSDDQMIELWLGRYRSRMTLSAFRNDVEHFRRAVPKPLREVVLRDIQAWGLAMEAVHKPASVARRLSACVRSLFAFAHRGRAPAMLRRRRRDDAADRGLSGAAHPDRGACGVAARRPARTSGTTARCSGCSTSPATRASPRRPDLVAPPDPTGQGRGAV